MKRFFICIILLVLLTFIVVSQTIAFEELKSFLKQQGFIENTDNKSITHIRTSLYEDVMGKTAPRAKVHAETGVNITYNYFIYDYDKTSKKQLVFFIFAWFKIDGEIYQFYKYNKDLEPCNTKKWIDYNRDNEEQEEEVFYIWF